MKQAYTIMNDISLSDWFLVSFIYLSSIKKCMAVQCYFILYMSFISSSFFLAFVAVSS